MKKAWKWVVGIGAGIIAILAFVLYRKYQKDHVDSLKDALVVAKAEKEIIALDTERILLEDAIGNRDEEIAIVKDKLDANKRSIVEARTGAEGLDEDGILELYRKMGYL
jgi:hypothetical protein